MSAQAIGYTIVSAIGLLGVILSLLSFFVKTPEGKKFEISSKRMGVVVVSAIILSVGLVLLQQLPSPEDMDDLPEFDWDYESFDGANLCIITHDGDSYSAKDVSLGIGYSEGPSFVICESASQTIWVEIHPLASYLVSAFFDYGEYSRMVVSEYTQLPKTSSPNSVEIVHLYLP